MGAIVMKKMATTKEKFVLAKLELAFLVSL
jgi:hypothetical protein